MNDTTAFHYRPSVVAARLAEVLPELKTASDEALKALKNDGIKWKAAWDKYESDMEAYSRLSWLSRKRENEPVAPYQTCSMDAIFIWASDRHYRASSIMDLVSSDNKPEICVLSLEDSRMIFGELPEDAAK